MWVLWSSLFWFLGLIIGSFGVIQVLIILFFSIPFTKKISEQGAIFDKNRIIYKRNIITVILWIIIILVSIGLVLLFASSAYFRVFCIGIGCALFLGLGKIGGTETNIKEYFYNYKQFIIIEHLGDILIHLYNDALLESS